MTWKLRAGDSRRGGRQHPQVHLHPCSPPKKSQSPAGDLHQKRHPRPTNPLPLPGGCVPGMGEGSWEGNIVLPPLTHHRPLGVPWLRAWRWGRRECFRRLTHHIQAQSRHPSWAPDGRAGPRFWWARWLSRASCPWCFRHWSPGFHRRPAEGKKEKEEDRGGRRRRETEWQVMMEGRRGKSEGKRRDSKRQKKRGDSGARQNAKKQVTVGRESTQEERWEATGVQRDTVTAGGKGKGGQIEEKLHIEYSER